MAEVSSIQLHRRRRRRQQQLLHSPTMLLISYENTLLQSLFQERFAPGYISPSPPTIHSTSTKQPHLCRATPTAINQIVSDFDGVTYHITTSDSSKSKILISISVKCFQELVQYGAHDVLQREYGPYIVEPEPGYDFSIQVDLENLPAEQGLSICKSLSNLLPQLTSSSRP